MFSWSPWIHRRRPLTLFTFIYATEFSGKIFLSASTWYFSKHSTNLTSFNVYDTQALAREAFWIKTTVFFSARRADSSKRPNITKYKNKLKHDKFLQRDYMFPAFCLCLFTALSHLSLDSRKLADWRHWFAVFFFLRVHNTLFFSALSIHESWRRESQESEKSEEKKSSSRLHSWCSYVAVSCVGFMRLLQRAFHESIEIPAIIRDVSSARGFILQAESLISNR